LKHIKVGDKLKRLLSVALVILLMFFTLGCPDKKESNGDNEDKTSVKRIEIKSANLLMENYMRFLMIGNHGAMKSFYSAGLKKKLKIKAVSADVLPAGYSVGEAEIMMEKANYKVNIYNSNRKGAYFSDDEFKYVVKQEGNKLVIDDISKEKSTELFKEGKSLFKRMDEKLKGDKIISLTDLPNYITAKEASSVEQKFPMPKKDFGPCALSPDGKTIVFSSTDKSSFIGILKENEDTGDSASTSTSTVVSSVRMKAKTKTNGEAAILASAPEALEKSVTATASTAEAGVTIETLETLAMSRVQQGEKDKQKSSGNQEQGSGSSSGSGSGQENSSGGSSSESSNYKIKTVDLYFGSEIKNITFSQDGKLFVVEYRPSGGQSKIAVYISESGEKYILKSNQQFSTSKFSFTNPYFASPKELIFSLTPTSKASSAEIKFKGDWRLDIEKGILKQF
jgi:uncharacterized membrane protein YgcG